MDSLIRGRLAMAARVIGFSQADPSTDASYTSVLSRLQDAATQGEAQIIQQRDGVAADRAAVAHRNDLRNTLQDQLRHLVRVARTAAATDPEFAGRFVYPTRKEPYKVVLTAAKAMLATATASSDLLLGLGLGATALTDIGQTVEQLDAATDAANAAHRVHVGARAELLMLGRQISVCVNVLDGLNRARYSDSPDQWAAWRSAKRVLDPVHHVEPAPAPPVPVPAPAAERTA